VENNTIKTHRFHSKIIKKLLAITALVLVVSGLAVASVDILHSETKMIVAGDEERNLLSNNSEFSWIRYKYAAACGNECELWIINLQPYSVRANVVQFRGKIASETAVTIEPSASYSFTLQGLPTYVIIDSHSELVIFTRSGDDRVQYIPVIKVDVFRVL